MRKAWRKRKYGPAAVRNDGRIFNAELLPLVFAHPVRRLRLDMNGNAYARVRDCRAAMTLLHA